MEQKNSLVSLKNVLDILDLLIALSCVNGFADALQLAIFWQNQAFVDEYFKTFYLPKTAFNSS